MSRLGGNQLPYAQMPRRTFCVLVALGLYGLAAAGCEDRRDPVAIDPEALQVGEVLTPLADELADRILAVARDEQNPAWQHTRYAHSGEDEYLAGASDPADPGGPRYQVRLVTQDAGTERRVLHLSLSYHRDTGELDEEGNPIFESQALVLHREDLDSENPLEGAWDYYQSVRTGDHGLIREGTDLSLDATPDNSEGRVAEARQMVGDPQVREHIQTLLDTVRSQFAPPQAS